MEKKIEFLSSRTVSQLANIVYDLASDLRYNADNVLTPISPDSDLHEVCKHDVTCLNLITTCDSLIYVINELKSTFI